MASHPESLSMALFCDFENVALGVRDAQYEKFDIKPILERLLLKGSIVVKKAYCDWDRYKGFKAAMHEANFELIEIPHVRQSGKNSADIRLVVDALDLCYTKAHVDTFVIISGDSDFSPLVSKLRENAKQVIGVGIKQSTSDLLIANCDEFIFYDDLVRENQRAAAARREPRGSQQSARRTADEDKPRKDDLEARRTKAIELAVATFDALVSERGDSGKMWASVLKEAIKRRRPDFNESYFGFKAFGNLLEAAQQRGLIQVGRDEKSGTYVYRSLADEEGEGSYLLPTPSSEVLEEAAQENDARTDAASAGAPASDSRRRGRGGRGNREHGRHESAAGLPATTQRSSSAEAAVATESHDREAESVEAGLRTGDDTALARSQDPDATVASDPAAAQSVAPATQRENTTATARQAHASTTAVEAARPGRNTDATKTAEATRTTPESVEGADRQQHAGARDDGGDSPVPREARARASKTRSGSARSAKKTTATAPAATEPKAAGSQEPGDATETTAGQPAKKAARKRSATRAAKKTGNAGKSEKSRDSDGE